MGNSVTISKEYLETLLRRAELHETSDCIKIPLAQYNSLVRGARHFSYLKAALISGGTSEETLNVLISSQSSQHPEIDDNHVVVCGSQEKAAVQPLSYAEPIGQHNEFQRRRELDGPDSNIAFFERSTMPPTPTSISHSEGVKLVDKARGPHPLYESCHRDRSVMITGLADSVSLLDLTKVIRGGLVSNIYIRRHTRSAHVSFVDPEAAVRFIEYSQQTRIAIKGAPVKVCWDNYQSYLSAPIISRIVNEKATRCLIIQFPARDLTAKGIKEDLDHIHRLEVIDIQFRENDCCIHLNSIVHAISAKHCMQSRLKYKKNRIEYGVDECEEALPVTNISPKQRMIPTTVAKPVTTPFRNRFYALASDSEGSESEGESDWTLPMASKWN